ncbi:hypothetical protein E3N88_16186 [Mikania micrantha]|uniref:Uncharacterized protein n=1 Tax=Mikania micrantha TaxID=192012 RepID=A0A5N6P0C7_9ASTR|nr:hypothetical protein E3N88_16186 [Mikania micrantha]
MESAALLADHHLSAATTTSPQHCSGSSLAFSIFFFSTIIAISSLADLTFKTEIWGLKFDLVHLEVENIQLEMSSDREDQSFMSNGFKLLQWSPPKCNTGDNNDDNSDVPTDNNDIGNNARSHVE